MLSFSNQENRISLSMTVPRNLIVYVVADNTIGESTYFQGSNKWVVQSPERKIIRSGDLDYFDGEEVEQPAKAQAACLKNGALLSRRDK